MFIMLTGVFYWALALNFVASSSAQSANITQLFSSSLSPGAEILLPTDADYGDATQRWTLHDAPSYLGAIKVATEADVANIVSTKIMPNKEYRNR